MTIKSSLYFIFNNITSEEMGIYNVNVDSSNGLMTEPFVPSRKILEQQIRGKTDPYFFGFQYDPLVIPVSFAFKDTFDSDKIRDIANWLQQDDYYKPLQFSDMLDRIFYAVVQDNTSLYHNGTQGYFTINFRCNSPFAYTPVERTNVLDYSSNITNGTNYTIINVGDLPAKPLITIQVVSGGTFTISNTSNGGQKLNFTGLADNETLTIDCDAEDIQTDLSNTNRYSNMSNDSEFIELPKGYNYLNIQGNVKIQFEWQSALRQG